MRASASRTEISKSDIDATVRRILNPSSSPPPPRYQPTEKRPGSKELILGRWVEVGESQ